MARDYAREYARRIELAEARGFTGSDITQAARGRATASGITSASIRDLERNPTDQPVTVVAYTDKQGNGRIVQVTHDAKGRAHVKDLKVPADRLRQLEAEILDRIEESDLEVY